MLQNHLNPVQWNQAQGLSRQSCARIFRDGGSPADALAAFGLGASDTVDWSKAVDLIAQQLCAATPRAMRKAA
ncbi:MAG: hypothetical protein ABL904_07905 [Hyphomicrobiaceae bacterium]